MHDKRFVKNYDSFHKDIYRLAFSYTQNKSDSDDITQKVFIKYYKNIEKIKNNEDTIRKWLVITTINECKDLLKNNWYKKVLTTDEELIIKVQNNEENLNYYINKLPDKYRIIFHLYYYYGYKTNEIAKITNINENTIKQRLKRGREFLKLDKEDNNE